MVHTCPRQVRQKYGKGDSRSSDAVGKARQAQDYALEARQKLEERGEKLRNLEDKASDMENAAAGFADMAKRLREQQEKKSKFSLW